MLYLTMMQVVNIKHEMQPVRYRNVFLEVIL